MSEVSEAIQAKCLAFGDRIIKLNDYLLEQAAIANAEKQKAMRHRKGTSSIYHQTSSILPMSVEADFIKVALDSRLNKQGVTMYLQLHSAKFSKE